MRDIPARSKGIAENTAINAIWTIADIANGLMAFPNLVALFMLRKVIFEETRKFFSGKKGCSELQN